MLKNYLKTFWKVTKQNKLFTFLSLFGISLTMMFVMILSMTVNKVITGAGPEKNLDRILFAERLKMRSLTQKDLTNSSDIDRKLCEDHFKNVENASISSMYTGYSWDFIKNGSPHSVGFMSTDNEFWDIFSFKFTHGRQYSVSEVVNDNNVAVISENLRSILFGNETDVLGKTVDFHDYKLTIIGVVEDAPSSCQNVRSDLFFPYTVLSYDQSEWWPYMGSFNMAYLATGKKQFSAIRKEFQEIVGKINSADPKWDIFIGGPFTQKQKLLAGGDPENLNSSKKRLKKYIQWALGFILLPAINLMALNFARIRERGEEIAIRKSFGASASILRGQFIVENILLTVLGTIIGILLSILIVLFLGDILTIPIKWRTTVPMSLSFDLTVIGIAFGVSLIFAFLSGILPAIRMSKMKPVKYLKGGEI